MRKLILSIFTFALSTSAYFSQCNVSINADKAKFCSDEKGILTAKTADSKKIPDYSESKKVFDLKDAKIDPSLLSLINSGVLTGVKIPLGDTIKGFSNIPIPGIQLKNAIITTGKIKIGIETDLKQDLSVYFQLPYFKINGKPLTDSIVIKGSSISSTGILTFSKELDLKNAIVDFSAGNSNLYNTINYKVLPVIKVSTKILTGTEIGNLQLSLSNLEFTENVKYEWFLDNAMLNNEITPTIEVTKGGTYKVKTTSSCGTGENSIQITVIERPSKDVKVDGKLTFCDGDSVKLSALGIGSFKWNNSSTNSSIIVKKTGTYNVIKTNDICTSTSDPINVTVNPNPIVKLNHKDTTIVIGSKLTLKATGAKEYLWNNQSKLDSIVLKEAGKYSVVGKNEYGCSNSVNFELKLREKGVGLEILNALHLNISPNPVSEILTVTVDNFKNNALSIVDLKGNQILTQPLTDNKTEINVNSFAKGIYLVNISDNANTVLNTKRFVVE